MNTTRLSTVVVSVFALLFLALGSVNRSHAQVLYGSVSGTITDQSGAAVVRAHVLATNRATGVQRETETDEKKET